MRFKCNQFGFQEDGSAAFAGAALYASISRMNHSCRPSAVMAYKESVCKVNQMPFNVATDGGVRVAISARDLQPGERLTFSYYAPCSDPAMAVEERRAVLMHRYGFRCGCERCDAEGGAVVAAAGGSSSPAKMPIAVIRPCISAMAAAVNCASSGLTPTCGLASGLAFGVVLDVGGFASAPSMRNIPG